MQIPTIPMLFAAMTAMSAPVLAESGPNMEIAGATCETIMDPDLTMDGNATEPATGRTFFLEYPCNLAPGEDVTFILNLHGAGSYGNWQRQYFPASDYVDTYNLVVASPTAATAEPIRRWMAEADDEYLHNIVDLVTDAFGSENISAFWLAGHSQGGSTSHRIICDDYFREKVDGMISLAGGRVGMRPETMECDYNFIFTTGDQDSFGRMGIPVVSPMAENFNCGIRRRTAIIEDTVAGKVWDSRTEGRPDRAGWGGDPGPGDADVFQFENCDEGMVVADVIRLNKGHTEGLEPRITEELVRLMLSAPGGKISGM